MTADRDGRDPELSCDLRSARRAQQQLHDLPLARRERYAALVGQDQGASVLARPQLVEQPRHEPAWHGRLATKSAPDDVRQARRIEVLCHIAARACAHGCHELLLVEPARQEDHGGRRDPRGDLVHHPEPLAVEVEAQEADVGTVPHSRVHGRLCVGRLGAACLRLERQTESDTRGQPLSRDEHMCSPSRRRIAHAGANSEPADLPTTICPCACSSPTTIVSLSRA